MRVLFISANREEINMPTLPWGLACVAAATKHTGHDVRLIDLMHEMDARSAIHSRIEELQPDIIGVSVRNIDDQASENPKFLLDEAKEVVALCKGLSKAPVVLGGAGYSIFPDSALSYLGADMGIQGEGESAFPALLEHIQDGRSLSGLPGLYLPELGLQATRRYVRDLDDLPLPDVELLSVPKDNKLWIPFQTRRGCPMACSYCSTPAIEGRILRQRSPEKVVQGLAHYAEAGFNRVFFVDNTFNLPASYAGKLCAEIAQADLGLVWRSIVYPMKLNPALAAQMAAAGCNEVSVGSESGCEGILQGMNKRFTPEEVRETCRILAGNGIRRMGFLMLGAPGETKASVEESLVFADSLDLEAVRITVGIRIYPNTQLAKIAVQEGIISAEKDLLFPRFYIARGLEGWLRQTVRAWAAQRPNWIV
jgi:radical SAM superfamily enzyme YgiQ (UPF0313 family)